jgi:tRNA pseudouridine38-40 synthase
LRYFFHIGYNGSNYRGWQRQKGVVSIQQVFEENLHQVLKTKVICLGCGRTDAMVHASQYFFHIEVENVWKFDLLARLNKMLPRDIAVFDIINVENNAHAQFDAISRTYEYFIHTYKDPFLNELSALYLERNFDLIKMQQAADLLKKYTDFKAFCLTPDRHTTTICNITNAQFYSDKNGDRIRFQISSNRFLKAMVRIFVRKFIDIGTGKLSINEFENILITQKPFVSNKLAFPQGLYLSKVTYPFLDIQPKTKFPVLKDDWQVV